MADEEHKLWKNAGIKMKRMQEQLAESLKNKRECKQHHNMIKDGRSMRERETQLHLDSLWYKRYKRDKGKLWQAFKILLL